MDDLSRRTALKVAAFGVVGLPVVAVAQEPKGVPKRPGEFLRFDSTEIFSRNVFDNRLTLSLVREDRQCFLELRYHDQHRDSSVWVRLAEIQQDFGFKGIGCLLHVTEVRLNSLEISARVKLDVLQRSTKQVMPVFDETITVQYMIPYADPQKISGQEEPFVTFKPTPLEKRN